MTRQADLGWSLSRSPAIIDARSMTQTSPEAAESCFPTASRIVWAVATSAGLP